MKPEVPPIADPHSTAPLLSTAPVHRTWKTLIGVVSFVFCGVVSLGLGLWIAGQLRSSPEFESWPLGWLIVGVCALVTWGAFREAWRIWKRKR